MIRTATAADVEALMGPVQTLVEVMNAVGNDQWGPHYPVADDFWGDVAHQALFVDEFEGALRGVVALDQNEPAGYHGLPWSFPAPVLAAHRLAVLPGYQRQGVADGLLAFAESLARQRGLAGLRSDTAEVNPAMNALFAKRGWRFVGTLTFPDAQVTFRAWEKAIF